MFCRWSSFHRDPKSDGQIGSYARGADVQAVQIGVPLDRHLLPAQDGDIPEDAVEGGKVLVGALAQGPDQEAMA